MRNVSEIFGIGSAQNRYRQTRHFKDLCFELLLGKSKKSFFQSVCTTITTIGVISTNSLMVAKQFVEFKVEVSARWYLNWIALGFSLVNYMLSILAR